MFLIDSDSAERYLRSTGRLVSGESVRVRRLSGGVSNEVLYVERTGGEDFVLKQARPQLRVADPWFCSIERIWREVETLRVCTEALERAASARPPVEAIQPVFESERPNFEIRTPELLFEDRENYVFAMTAAPPHEAWKQRLLSGCAEPAVASACGRLLAVLHAGAWRNESVATRLRDRSFFDDLRIDPYYRRIAQVHPDLKDPIHRLIQSLAENCVCLVHGDFSPKNLLVFDPRGSVGRPGLMLVDFEVGHFGDPAFDLGFFLAHLVLKAYWSGSRFDEYFHLSEEFWTSYLAGMSHVGDSVELRSLVARGIRNFAACMLARIDGKSKVEYLTDETLRDAVRGHARVLLFDPPATWDEVRERLLRA